MTVLYIYEIILLIGKKGDFCNLKKKLNEWISEFRKKKETKHKFIVPVVVLLIFYVGLLLTSNINMSPDEDSDFSTKESNSSMSISRQEETGTVGMKSDLSMDELFQKHSSIEIDIDKQTGKTYNKHYYSSIKTNDIVERIEFDSSGREIKKTTLSLKDDGIYEIRDDKEVKILDKNIAVGESWTIEEDIKKVVTDIGYPLVIGDKEYRAIEVYTFAGDAHFTRDYFIEDFGFVKRIHYGDLNQSFRASKVTIIK